VEALLSNVVPKVAPPEPHESFAQMVSDVLSQSQVNGKQSFTATWQLHPAGIDARTSTKDTRCHFEINVTRVQREVAVGSAIKQATFVILNLHDVTESVRREQLESALVSAIAEKHVLAERIGRQKDEEANRARCTRRPARPLHLLHPLPPSAREREPTEPRASTPGCPGRPAGFARHEVKNCVLAALAQCEALIELHVNSAGPGQCGNGSAADQLLEWQPPNQLHEPQRSLRRHRSCRGGLRRHPRWR